MPSSSTYAVSRLGNTTGGPGAISVGNAPSSEEWQQWFGLPNRPIETNPYDNYRQSTFAMPEGYKGSNAYMQMVLIQLILDEDLWAINFALPFRREENSIEIKWDVIEFTNNLLGPVPEEGTSRLVSQQRSEKSDHMQRYGLGFLIEHGFMRTERGRLSYTMHLKQIKNAVLETAYYLVLDAYLRCKNAGQVWQMRYGKAMTLQVQKRIRDNEVEEFGLIQKQEHGFDLLHIKLKRDMVAKNGITPNMWIVKEGTKSYLSNVRRENYAYFLKGPEGPNMYKTGLANNGSEEVAISNDCMIFEAKSIEIPGENEPVDLLTRSKTIGEFYPMMPHTDVDATYTSAQRSVTLYDARKDGFTKIDLSAALEACPRFNRDGSLNFDSVDPDNCDGDPFLHEEGGRNVPVQFFGDMHQDHLKDRVLRDFTTSALKVFSDNRKNEMRAHLEDGLNLIQELEDIPSTNSADQTSYFSWMAYVYSNKTRGTVDSATGLMDLPTPASVYVSGTTMATHFNGSEPKFVPSGYSTFAGLQVLAKPGNKQFYKTYQERAERFVNAISEIYSRLSLTCRGTRFCDPSFQPSYLPKPDGRNTLVSNIVTLPQPPIILSDTPTIGVGAFTLSPNLFPASGAAAFENAIKGNPRFAPLFAKAFKTGTTELVDDYTSSDLYNGYRLGKLEALICALLSEASTTVSGESGISKLSDIAPFDPKTDSPFQCGSKKSSPEEITMCKEVSNAIIRMLQAIGLDTGIQLVGGGGANIDLAYNIIILLAALRFGAKSVPSLTIAGLSMGLSYIQDYETLVAYVDAANTVFTSTSSSQEIREKFGAELKTAGLLGDKYDDMSSLRSKRRDTGVTGYVTKVLPLAGSQAIYAALSGATPTLGLTVSNDGNYGKNNNVATRGARYTYASFDLAESTLSHRPRFTEAGFDRQNDYLDGDYSFDDSSRSRFMSRSDKRRRTDHGWSMGFGSDGMQQGRSLAESSKHFGEGITIAFSTNFIERFRTRVSVENDIITRCVYSCFLACDVHRNTLQNFIDKNVVFPFSFILMRPYIEMRMAAGILAKAGRETGETLIGPHNFMLGDDAVRKLHHGNFTINMAPVIYNDRAVHLQPDMNFDSYVRGMDCTFVRNVDDHAAYVHSGGNGRSIYSILEPYEGAERVLRNNPIDITGHFTGMENSSYDGDLMYSSAKWYNNYFQWQNDTMSDPNQSIFFASNRINSCLYQGYTGLYNHVTRQNDCIMPPTGHLGNVYQGVVGVWNGRMQRYERVTYPNVYGGASQISHNVIIN